MNLEYFLSGYANAALWPDSVDDARPAWARPVTARADDGTAYSCEELAQALEIMRRDCAQFVTDNMADLDAYATLHAPGDSHKGAELAGRDFWVTRNGGSGALGERLSNAARAYGACAVYDAEEYARWRDSLEI